MIMMGVKKEKTRASTLCNLVHKNSETLASQDHDLDGRQRVGLCASIFEFIKPRCSLWNNRKKKRPLTPEKHQQQQQILKSMSNRTLQEWIMNSPSLNIQFSGRIHPSFEESVKATASNSSRPRDSLSVERVKVLRMIDCGDKEAVEAAAASICRRQSGKRKKKVSFRLPEVADVFILDSADGYYFSK